MTVMHFYSISNNVTQAYTSTGLDRTGLSLIKDSTDKDSCIRTGSKHYQSYTGASLLLPQVAPYSLVAFLKFLRSKFTCLPN